MSLLKRWFDARVAVWLLLLVMATGVPLMVWFDADPAAHAARLGPIELAVRGLHHASSALLVLAVVGHAVLRLRAKGVTWKGVRTGSLALLSVMLAAVSGAFIAQTAAADRLLAELGWTSPRILTWLAIGHIAYASILVLVAVYLHIAKWGWRVVQVRDHAVAAIVLSALVALVVGTSVPGDNTMWRTPTALLVPPIRLWWAAPALLAMGAWVASPFLARWRA